MRKSTLLTLYMCGCLILLAVLSGCSGLAVKATYQYPAPESK